MRALFRIIAYLFLFSGAIGILTHCESNSQVNNDRESGVNDNIKDTSSQHVVCLVYHRFGNAEYPSTNIDTNLFRKHLKYLRSNNYQVLTLGKAVGKLKAGELTGGKYAVITVDDGYRSFKSGAMPILERFGFRATLFVNSSSVGGGSYMDWRTLKALKKSGIEIGNHSHTHPHFLNKADQKGFKRYFSKDLKKAQEAFQKHLGFTPDLYAYPYGEYNPDMIKILKKSGFNGATGQHSGVFYKSSNLFAIPRFPMAGRFAKMESFKSKVAMKALPVKCESPKETIVKENPPTLSLTFKEVDEINLNNIQCFVSGKNSCAIEKDLTADPPAIQFKAKKSITGRRVKYTITAPSKGNGQWHWYSKLWVQPGKEE